MTFIFGVLLACLASIPAHAQLRVSAVDWVQGRPEIPHPALNGDPPFSVHVEGGNWAGIIVTVGIEIGTVTSMIVTRIGGTHSGGHRAGYFAPAGLEVQFPDAAGDRLYYPRLICALGRFNNIPVLVRVERVCGGYPDNINGNVTIGCPGLTRQLYRWTWTEPCGGCSTASVTLATTAAEVESTPAHMLAHQPCMARA